MSPYRFPSKPIVPKPSLRKRIRKVIDQIKDYTPGFKLLLTFMLIIGIPLLCIKGVNQLTKEGVDLRIAQQRTIQQWASAHNMTINSCLDEIQYRECSIGNETNSMLVKVTNARTNEIYSVVQTFNNMH